jgi:hypothetical protein
MGRGLFDTNVGIRERSKLAQLARGFLYEGTGKDRTTRPIASRKPSLVARLVAAEVEDERPTIVWTNFDEESAIVAAQLRKACPEWDAESIVELSGATPEAEATAMIDRFRHGGVDVLVTKAQLAGFGLNFQRCKAMVFSGIDDSFERRYQCVRRAYRFGQRDSVNVHLPHVPELEGLMLENVAEKEQAFEADVAQAERNYVKAVERES